MAPPADNAPPNPIPPPWPVTPPLAIVPPIATAPPVEVAPPTPDLPLLVVRHPTFIPTEAPSKSRPRHRIFRMGFSAALMGSRIGIFRLIRLSAKGRFEVGCALRNRPWEYFPNSGGFRGWCDHVNHVLHRASGRGRRRDLGAPRVRRGAIRNSRSHGLSHALGSSHHQSSHRLSSGRAARCYRFGQASKEHRRSWGLSAAGFS